MKRFIFRYAKATRTRWQPLLPHLHQGTPHPRLTSEVFVPCNLVRSLSIARAEPSADGISDFGDIDKACLSISQCSAMCNHDLEDSLAKLAVPLSTNLVVGVLRRFHSEEKLAFRFFMWAGNQDNYAHEPAAYNEMIDILSSTSYKVKQFRIVCDMLDYMKRSKKHVVPVGALVEVLRRYTLKYETHVRKFSKKKQIQVKKHPEINAFNVLLDTLCKCCLVEEAESLVLRLRGTVKPDASTYNILFFGWCRVRNPARAMKSLEEMIKLGQNPDSFMYNTAIDTFCKAEMLDDAVRIFKFMKTEGSQFSSPTAKTYGILILAMMQHGRTEEYCKLLDSMIESGCLPDVSIYKDLIEGMCLTGKIDQAFDFLQEMRFKGYPPDIVTYNCFMNVLCENKKSDDAIKLYNRMLEMGCRPSVQTYNMLLGMFFEMDNPDGAIDTWQEMEQRGCIRDVDSYSAMIEGLFGCDRKENACELIDEIVNRGMKLPYKIFDAFLSHLSKAGDIRAIHNLSDHMKKFYNYSMARRIALNEKRKRSSFRRT